MKKKNAFIIILLLIGITLITVGTTYALLSLRTSGTETTSVKSGKITLHYEEEELTKLNITNAYISNNKTGKQQDYFEFEITSDTANFNIPYVITARKQGTEESRIPDEAVTIYITEVVNGEEKKVLLANYSELETVLKNNNYEQRLFRKTVPKNTLDYSKKYRLRLWINDNAEFSPEKNLDGTYKEDGEGNLVYPLQDKSFNITINAYTDVQCEHPVAFTKVDQTKETLEMGDEVVIDTEHFIVVSSDPDDTVLIAKYNVIPLGYATPMGSVEGRQYNEAEKCTGNGRCKNYGRVAFSKIEYWDGQYGTDEDLYKYAPYVYDSSLVSAPVYTNVGHNYWDGDVQIYYPNAQIIGLKSATPDTYSIAYYVEDYKNTINTMGAYVENARLLYGTEYQTLRNSNINLNNFANLDFYIDSTYTPIECLDEYCTDYSAGNFKTIRPVLEVQTCTID